jgi:hypothetical protein
MIGAMALRWTLVCVAFAITAGCGGPKVDPGEPQTAKEKQMREAQASGDVDPPGTKWGGWRYQGDRQDCFFLVGRKCFRTYKRACATACKSDKQCKSDDGAPATVSCKPQ